MATAVLDVGKTNVKVVVFDGASILWQRSSPNAPLAGPPYPHCNAAAALDFFMNAIAEAARSHAIDTVVVTTHGATAALIDDRDLVLPIMDYEFADVNDIEDLYSSYRPPFSETRSPPLAAGLNIGRQLFWQETHLPEAFAKARHVLMYPQYFGWRLTGTAANEVTSLGCHADLWRPDEGRASSLVERRGLMRLMPPVRRAYEQLGPLKPEIAARTGLPSDIRVLVGVHDSNASLLPHLAALSAPFTVISTGTWVVIMAVGAPTAKLDPTRDMYANVDITGRPYPCAKFMGGREFATILEGAQSVAEVADLDAVLLSGAMALPAFTPSGGPYSGRQGRIQGYLPDRPRARAALASLYAALVTDAQLDNLGADKGPLAIEGSFAGNSLYCAILATLRPDQPVLLSPDTAGTAYGASLLTRWPGAPERAPMPRVQPLAERAHLLAHRLRWRETVDSQR
jgi:sugar (pentulose or hexulose) kinase